MRKLKNIILIILIFIVFYAISNLFKINKIESVERKEEQKLEAAKHKGDEEQPYINFEYLYELNENIIGWIKIPETRLDYPILQGNDNEFYLTHSYLNSPNYKGAIFLDYKNTNTFTDTITTIYGHNVADEEMFGVISKYKNEKFKQEHQAIKLYIDGLEYDCLVDQFYEVNMNEIATIRNQNIEINERKLMLVTCSYSNEKGINTDLRYVLIATIIE